MTSFDDLDRRLTARLDERAAPRAPNGLSGAISKRIAGTSQRPAWATLERWIPMETRAQFGAVPRAVVVLALLALLTLVMATALAIGASNPPKLPPPFGTAGNGLIAFESDGDIYTIQPDGTEMRRLTSDPVWEGNLLWSRDGTRLAFWKGPEDGPFELVVASADGESQVVIAEASGETNGEIWSADGTEIMYSASDPARPADTCPGYAGYACGSRLFVARTDGSGSRMVGDAGLDARAPALSPDGVTVAFGGGEAGNEALYLMDWDGSDVRRLETDIPGGGWAFAHQSWAPDGRRLATHDGRNAQSVWLVDLDESGALESVQRFDGGFWPDYAPDGRLRWLISLGTMAVALPGDEDSKTFIADIYEDMWSPDGDHIVGIRDGELVVLDRNGEQVVSLGIAADESIPAWQRVAE